MGKKPVLGLVSALCVGLALTGCRDAATRSDSTMASKSTLPPYKTPAAFTMNGSNTATPPVGWNTTDTGHKMGATTADPMTAVAPPPKPSPDFRFEHASSVDPQTVNRMTPVGIQTTSMAPLPPPPPQMTPEQDAAPTRMSDRMPTPDSMSRFQPAPAKEVYNVPGASATVLPRTPSLTNGPSKDMPLTMPEPPAPIEGPNLGALPPPPPPPEPTPTLSAPLRDPPPPPPPPSFQLPPPPPAPPGPTG